MRNIITIGVIVSVITLWCIGYPDRRAAYETRKLMNEAYNQIGMPNIRNFQQRKTLKMILELCDREDLVCYAYIFAEDSGKLIYLGRCIGFGIPFSAQYTNPVRKMYDGNYIPQPGPNGLFMPTTSSATWLLLIDPETNKPRPVYVEPPLVVSPFPLTLDGVHSDVEETSVHGAKDR